MAFDQFTEGQAQFLFHDAGLVHMARDLEQLRTGIARIAKALEPVRPAPQDRRCDSNAFNIVDRRRAAIETRPGRKWRLQSRLALLAFKAFEHRGFFAADIGARAPVDEHVEIIAGLAGILADKARGIGLSILLWFYFTILYDALMLMVMFAFIDYPMESVTLLMVMCNPIDLARVVVLLQLDISALMGYTGAMMQEILGKSRGVTVATVVMLLWMMVPLAIATVKFKKRDL